MFRGIFLNDEDWGLQPWAAKIFEPEVGDIGPKTYEKIFQLLLRLRANMIWPEMHKSTKSFFSIEGNKAMAKKYHIYVGTSHAEPMLRNNVDEWNEMENEPYNWFTNKDRVKKYWQERLDETKDGYYIYTMGMRGIHDSGMQGGKTKEERVQAVEDIIKTQRKMLTNTLDKPIDQIPQVFIPYKEVLSIYNNGLELPEDITLMWTDDNYGYIRRLSDKKERERNGGGGVYYHLSYWGRPHDYLWLSTTQPGLIWYEMSRAYQNGAKNIWIANVGDIKPAEYTTEFFLDLAWDVNSIQKNTIKDHLLEWAQREFGAKPSHAIATVMDTYYRLAFLRKPEFMGWSQTEPETPTYPSEFSVFNDDERQRRIDAYAVLIKKVNQIKKQISPEKMDAFFQLVEYPVKASTFMNFKFLKYQQSVAKSDDTQAKNARNAYDSIVALTEKYNDLNNGKWDNMLVMNPRNLVAYKMPDYQKAAVKTNKSVRRESPIAIQAKTYSDAKGAEGFEWNQVEGLGYGDSAVTLFPLENHKFDKDKPYLEYRFNAAKAGNYEVELRCLPTHANNFDFSVGIAINGIDLKNYTINTRGRSDEWKINVLRNSVQVNYPITIQKPGMQTLRIYVNHTGVVLDQIAINPENYPDYYEVRAGK